MSDFSFSLNYHHNFSPATMLRISLLLFCIAFSIGSNAQTNRFEVLESEQDGRNTLLRFQLDSYTIEAFNANGIQANRIVAPGSVPHLQKGCPDLPVFHAALQIPDLEGMQIEVVEAAFEEVSPVYIAPSQGNIKRSQNPSDIARIEGDPYSLPEWYPASPANLKTPYVFRNARAQVVEVSPFQYFPQTQTLRIYSNLFIRVSASPTEPVINPLHAHTMVSAEEKSIAMRNFINASNERYEALSEGSRMLIIAHDPFIPVLDEFRLWKLRCGIETEVVPASEVPSITAISDLIRNRYEGSGLQYVLLVGDIAQIPSPTRSGGKSDPSYGYLVGNDAYPEVMVGRISAETLPQVQTQLQRFLQYEQANAGTHFQKAVGIASQEGPGDDGELDFEHSRLMLEDLLDFTYTTGYELFEGDQGGADAPEWPEPTDLKTVLEQGAGLILYTGHGSSSSFGTSGFSNTDIAQLQNPDMLPVIWSVACVNGEFDNGTCFAEAWMRATQNGQPTGAASVLMSSINQSWNPPMCAQDEMVDILSGLVPDASSRRFGAISLNGCMKMNDEYGAAGDEMTDTWHIFGDPSLLLRTTTPILMTVTHPSTAIIGQNTLQAQCSVDGARLTLVQDGILLASVISANGIADFSMPPLASASPITITATAFNHAPYTGTINVEAGSFPFLVFSAAVISDPTGNNNQLADYGETVELEVRVQNIGTPTSGLVIGALSENSEWVELQNPGETCTFNNDLSEVLFSSSNCFSFTVSNAVPDQTVAVFQLQLSDEGGNTWNILFPVELLAPRIQILNYTLTELSGNGNNRPDEGESFGLSFTVSNLGHSPSQAGEGILIAGMPYLTTPPASTNQPGLLMNETQIHNYTLVFISDIPAGAELPLQYAANYQTYGDDLAMTLRINQLIEDWEGNSGLNWTADGAYPWTEDGMIKYEGFASMRSGSIGDNQQSELSLSFEAAEAGQVSFFRRVSCEEGWDFLRFYIDGVEQASWTGFQDWAEFSFPISAGSHDLTWIYMKDEMIADLLDAAWVDFISLPPQADVTSITTTTNNTWLVYPNPSRGSFFVRSTGNEDITLRLRDLSGRLLSEYVVQAGVQPIDFPAGMSSGVYLIERLSTSGIETQKLILRP